MLVPSWFSPDCRPFRQVMACGEDSLSSVLWPTYLSDKSAFCFHKTFTSKTCLMSLSWFDFIWLGYWSQVWKLTLFFSCRGNLGRDNWVKLCQWILFLLFLSWEHWVWFKESRAGFRQPVNDITTLWAAGARSSCGPQCTVSLSLPWVTWHLYCSPYKVPICEQQYGIVSFLLPSGGQRAIWKGCSVELLVLWGGWTISPIMTPLLPRFYFYWTS